MNHSQTNDRDPLESSQESLTPSQFAAQYRQLYPKLWLTAVGVIGDRAYADDIVQEAVIIALKKLQQFSVGTSLNAWLGEIVRRCALNYLRKTKNRGTVAADPAVLDRHQSGMESGPVATPTSLEELYSTFQVSFDDDVMRALNAVGEVARGCVLLRTVQGLSYAEIAELMGVPEGTAMSHVHRAKQRMRSMLQQKYRTE